MIVVLGPGGQYNHLIARRVSELGYNVILLPLGSSVGDADGVIIGGGPGSTVESVPEVKLPNVPLLGICYGHQLIAKLMGGNVGRAKKPEFGPFEVTVLEKDVLFQGVPEKFVAWMSHRDEVTKIPPDFLRLASSENCLYQAIRHEKRDIFGVQFHPEVSHTQHGMRILKNFLEITRR
ncbi:MAG: glutamine-hydrolyzing GMP synthase [Candidatus Methanodesulfokora sp.]|jgi:GMP synthase (glutamine-hydrolysing)